MCRTATETLNRRRFIAAGISATIAWRPAIGAPRPNARVGYLELVKDSDGEALYREFVEAMQGQGYAEGRNLRMTRRSGGGRPERLRPLAAELGASKLDVIMEETTEAARSAKVDAPGVPTIYVI